MNHTSIIRSVSYGALFALLYTIVLAAGNAALTIMGPAVPRAPVTQVGLRSPAAIVISEGALASGHAIDFAPPTEPQPAKAGGR